MGIQLYVVVSYGPSHSEQTLGFVFVSCFPPRCMEAEGQQVSIASAAQLCILWILAFASFLASDGYLPSCRLFSAFKILWLAFLINFSGKIVQYLIAIL